MWREPNRKHNLGGVFRENQTTFTNGGSGVAHTPTKWHFCFKRRFPRLSAVEPYKPVRRPTTKKTARSSTWEPLAVLLFEVLQNVIQCQIYGSLQALLHYPHNLRLKDGLLLFLLFVFVLLALAHLRIFTSLMIFTFGISFASASAR